MEGMPWSDKKGREAFENFAELYAIIKTTEKLEKAYVRDLVSSADYELECRKLIGQFKNLSNILRDVVPSIESFAEEYQLDCPAALNRLIKSGVPATEEHKVSAPPLASFSLSMVAECVQHFITAMDALELSMRAVDQVHPLLSDLSLSLGKLGGILPPEYQGREKVREWVSRLERMGASDELNEEEARQLKFDLESSHKGFHSALPKSG